MIKIVKNNLSEVLNMTFENGATLFLSLEECKLQDLKEFRKRYNIKIKSVNKSEGIAIAHIDASIVTIPFLLELEDALDSRIVLSSRFLGSSKAIKSLGLD